MAQEAKSIAVRLNETEPYFSDYPIDLDLVELAGLAHDLGHPPFGHNGEEALDGLLKCFGGFEGNAQTLRIVSRLEKKQTRDFPERTDVPEITRNGHDLRLGLNWTARSLASVLKYDKPIPQTLSKREKANSTGRPMKGHYSVDKDLVSWIKRWVVGEDFTGKLKTIECWIMDIADDIAYSTYDLEDSFKAGFLSPLELTAADIELKRRIAAEVEEKIRDDYANAPADEKSFGVDDLNQVLLGVVGSILFEPSESITSALLSAPDDVSRNAQMSEYAFSTSKLLCDVGYLRTDFTSSLVGTSIRNVEVNLSKDYPQLTKVRLDLPTFKMVETSKRFSYESIIMSPRIKLSERRRRIIIETIFEYLHEKQNGSLLIPDDWRQVYLAKEDDDAWSSRTVCDYIAGMTDRYCIEFYNRLVGPEVPSIHKGH